MSVGVSISKFAAIGVMGVGAAAAEKGSKSISIKINISVSHYGCRSNSSKKAKAGILVTF